MFSAMIARKKMKKNPPHARHPPAAAAFAAASSAFCCARRSRGLTTTARHNERTAAILIINPQPPADFVRRAVDQSAKTSGLMYRNADGCPRQIESKIIALHLSAAPTLYN